MITEAGTPMVALLLHKKYGEDIIYRILKQVEAKKIPFNQGQTTKYSKQFSEYFPESTILKASA
jgi:hypothetical protein